jgi:hypothetical protein
MGNHIFLQYIAVKKKANPASVGPVFSYAYLSYIPKPPPKTRRMRIRKIKKALSAP